ncbi:MAG TPA: hydrolase [Planctomycetaceae bacterium]|nr:hydrolase [Planctomycetaceae bacterium]
MNDKPRPVRHHELLSAARSRLLIVDVQEKLLPHITDGKTVVERCERLLKAAGILGVPISATEQYPQGLGPTVEPLRSYFEHIPEKLRFSCVDSLDWAVPRAEREDRDQIVVAGIETHVCILQTAFDLAAGGFRVYVPVDAVGSRFSEDRETALRRLDAAGIALVSTESVLFEWCEVAGTEQFKQISRLVR